jgi:hypothetical protein
MKAGAAVLALLALAVAGCGSDKDAAKEYRTKADAICARIKSERERLPPASNIEELRSVARSTIAINTDALRKFKELDPPGDLKGPHAVIVNRLGETLRLQEQAVKTDPASDAMRSINIRAGAARAALLAAAKQANLPACQRL